MQALMASDASSGAVLEAPALVTCLDDVAVMSEAIEQRRGHLGIAKYARPFAEGEICGDDDRGAFVEAADRVEQQLSTGLREGQIAEFVEDDEVKTGEDNRRAVPGDQRVLRPRAD